MNYVITSIFLCTFILKDTLTLSACTWPTVFYNSQWDDSSKGIITFTNDSMTGWDFIARAGSVDTLFQDWKCHSIAWFDTNNTLILRTANTFIPFDTSVYGYMCWKLYKITDTSFRYYIHAKEEVGLYGDRMLMKSDATVTNISVLCSEGQSYLPSLSEYRVMIKTVNKQFSKIHCPYVFLAKYNYIVTPCASANSNDILDMCTDNTQMTLSGTCMSKVTNAKSPTVWCVDTVPFEGNNYITVYNGNDNDADINNSSIFRFSCMAVSGDGTMMSIAPQQCRNGQTPAFVTSDTSVLANLTQKDNSSCPTCPLLSIPAQSTVSITSNGAITTATYKCKTNFTMSGNETRICQTNGTWSGIQPFCMCPTLDVPANGAVTFTQDGVTANYTCDAWFVLSGNASRMCNTTTNKWTGVDPICNKCQNLMAPTNGSFKMTSIGITSVATYSCNKGTTLNGTMDRICQTDQQWNLATPLCVSCSSLTNISSGTVSISSNGITTIATYNCSDGYNLLGSTERTCTTRGLWNSSTPICVCKNPSTILHGSLTVTQSAVTYTCELGFTLQGQSVSYCLANGTGWSNASPICVECSALTDFVNGSKSLTTNGTVTMVSYACNLGYTMNGTDTSACQPTGHWSSPKPVCTRCQSPPNVTYGTIVLNTNGSFTYAKYQCEVGATMNGNAMSICNINGSWSMSGSNASCVKCNNITTMSGRTFSLSSDGTTSKVTFTCNSGYELQGAFTLTCNKNGSWSGAEPECVSVSMTKSSSSSNNGNGLLSAVIALSVLVVATAVAFGVVMWLIRNTKKNIDKLIKKAERKKHTSKDGHSFLKSNAPADHQYAANVVNGRSTLSEVASPNQTLRKDPWNSLSTDAVQSSFSMQAQRLALIRDTTSSEIFSNDQPAPWSINKSVNKNQVKNFAISPIPHTDYRPIPKFLHPLTDANSHQENEHAHTKKRSLAAKTKEQGDVNNENKNIANNAHISGNSNTVVPRLIFN